MPGAREKGIASLYLDHDLTDRISASGPLANWSIW
jgi:hypothetical protein